MTNSFDTNSQGYGHDGPHGSGSAGWGGANAGNATPEQPVTAQGWQTAPPSGAEQSRQSGPKGLGALAIAALMLGSAAVGGGAAALVMSTNSSDSVTQNALNQPAETRQVAAPAGSVEEVAQKVLPSVVSITTEMPGGVASGSGSILSADGLVLTNHHVVAGAEEGGRMQVLLSDGSTHPAKVVASDSATDIAVIRIEGVNGLRPISLGNSSQVQVGQEVVAVGSPLGLTSTVTQGIVSAKNRPVTAAGENGESSVIDAIQTDAAINPGNSGGALVDMEGNLIGVPSVIASMKQGSEQAGSIGLGFAIPIDQARRIAEDLIETGHARMPAIGAHIDTRPVTNGALVREVTPGSPAEKAGLKPGDVITKLDDRSLDNGVALIAAIRSHRIGDSVTLTVTDDKGGNERTVDVTLAEAPN
nr:trypsin-like peptidase domain-containing protein [Corynebacterium lactis]